MMRIRQSLFCLVAVGLCFTAGCRFPGTAAPVDVWIASEMVSLTDATPPGDRQSGGIRLFSAANETVSFQMVVDAGPKGAEKVRIAFSSLKGDGGPIDAANVRLYRMLPVAVSEFPPWYLRLVETPPQPANYYDALAPFDSPHPQAGQSFALKPNERLAIWVDLRVPADAAAGHYRGAIEVSSSAGCDWTTELDVEVYGFVLPDARPFAAIGGFDHTSLFSALIQRNGKPFAPVHLDRDNPLVMEGLTIMRQLMRLAHEHRLDLFDREIRPVLKRNMLGQVRLDWDNYDAIVKPYLSGTAFEDRLGCQAWPIPFSDDWPKAKTYGGADTEAYVSTASSLLDQCARHFDDLDVSGQMFAWPYRGPVNQAGYDRHVRLARLVRASDAQTPILSHLPGDPAKLTGWRVPKDFTQLVDIVAPPAHWQNLRPAGRTARLENPLAGVWLSPGQPPYLPSLGVIASAADVRAIPWFAMKYECGGLFLPEVLHWREKSGRAGGIAKTRLFYPGTMAGLEGVVLPSVRLKRLRRGLQDVAYLWLLQQRRRGGIARAVQNAMVRYAGLDASADNYLDVRTEGWVKDGTTWEMARRLLAEEVHAAVKATTASNEQLLARRLEWIEFDERTHCVRIEQMRSRVGSIEPEKKAAKVHARLIPVAPTAAEAAADGKRVERKLRATILLDLFNEYAREVDVQVKIDSLPQGWAASGDRGRISRFAPASRQTITLVAEGTYIPVSGNAKIAIPVSIVTDMQQRDEIVAVVPFLRAGNTKAPPRIDGALDDWPMRMGNAAADFKLLGRRGRTGDGLAVRQTIVFVLADETNLYIAFRCQEPQLDNLYARASNIIHYEQLMACGEDLVEVILDPGASAGGPEDLYHLAVKSNGVILAERGVRTDPPLGRVEPWPAAVAVAVGQHENMWVVEMSIPLSAFGRAGRAKFWAVNFTRFATQGAEASSWSEAPRYFYDPRNLGTMLLAPPAVTGGKAK